MPRARKVTTGNDTYGPQVGEQPYCLHQQQVFFLSSSPFSYFSEKFIKRVCTRKRAPGSIIQCTTTDLSDFACSIGWSKRYYKKVRKKYILKSAGAWAPLQSSPIKEQWDYHQTDVCSNQKGSSLDQWGRLSKYPLPPKHLKSKILKDKILIK